jgi:hypothetical protein
MPTTSPTSPGAARRPPESANVGSVPLPLAPLVVLTTTLLALLGPQQPALATALTLALAAGMTAVLLTRIPVLPVPAPTRPGVSRRDGGPRILLRQCDPDAAGHARPRAPSRA